MELRCTAIRQPGIPPTAAVISAPGLLVGSGIDTGLRGFLRAHINEDLNRALVGFGGFWRALVGFGGLWRVFAPRAPGRGHARPRGGADIKDQRNTGTYMTHGTAQWWGAAIMPNYTKRPRDT